MTYLGESGCKSIQLRKGDKMPLDPALVCKEGVVERRYGNVTVSIHVPRDITLDDWMPYLQRLHVQSERDRLKKPDELEEEDIA